MKTITRMRKVVKKDQPKTAPGDGCSIKELESVPANMEGLIVNKNKRILKLEDGDEVDTSKQIRGWIYTLCNYTPKEIEQLQEFPTKYHIMGWEVAPSTGTPHIQGYLELNGRGLRFASMKKLNKRISWRVRRGTPEEASTYCMKTDAKSLAAGLAPNEKVWVSGSLPKQGARKDLQELKDLIVDGSKVDDVVMESPHLYHQYGRTLHKIEDICMRKRFRTEMTEGIWYFGETGVGKSHIGYEGFTPETHYIFPDDNGWWDGYQQQDTVVINEFRGRIPYGFLLELTDKWPVSVKRRHREPMPFTSKKIIITSSIPPEEIYRNLSAKDSLAQLYRRFEVFKVPSRGVLEKHVYVQNDETDCVPKTQPNNRGYCAKLYNDESDPFE